MNASDRARRYLAKLPPALSGSGGHNQTLQAACRLVEFGLREEEAFLLLAEWNLTHCKPSWGEGELRHKLADAFRRTVPRAPFAQRHTSTAFRPIPAPRLSSPLPPASPRGTDGPRIPILGPGTPGDFAAVARSRGLSAEAVALASGAGLVRFGTWLGARAWFAVDRSRRVAQARRVDGSPHAPGVKAWTLKGSQARWPVGIGETGDEAVVALVEGGPDLLAAFHCIHAQGRPDVAPVAILGAEVRIHEDALRLFQGKRVRIFGHDDDAGDRATNRWAEELTAAGADVDAFSFRGLTTFTGDPVKDLNDFARIGPDGSHADFIQALFP
ncbi:MAG: hypothetical protein DVB31_06225 [Verrucomicrobia bacterium]|nr:MAG: hypothetical protein DVB31_06225 [Verrucomicrobiota bacterium]